MNKHTPGNWYVAERTMWHAEVRFVRTSEDKSGVVGLTSDRDAKLVAAAPDLLTALTNLLNWGREHTSPTDPNSPHELLVAAHEAIEKAGGSVPDGENAGCDDCGMHDRVPGSKYCAECGSLDAAVRSVVNPALESLRHHVTGAIERGEGVAITEQRTDAKITELIRDVNDGDCALSAIFDDGSARKLFNFYIDELAFVDCDLIGKTESEAIELKRARDVKHLQS